MTDAEEWRALISAEADARRTIAPDPLTGAPPPPLTAADLLDARKRWWRATYMLAAAVARQVGKGEPVPSETFNMLGVMADLAKELATGKIPDYVRDVATAGSKSPDRLTSVIDYATAYIKACRGGCILSGRQINIVDNSPYKTINGWFNVTRKTSDYWGKRDIVYPMKFSEGVHDGDLVETFQLRVQKAGRDYQHITEGQVDLTSRGLNGADFEGARAPSAEDIQEAVEWRRSNGQWANVWKADR